MVVETLMSFSYYFAIITPILWCFITEDKLTKQVFWFMSAAFFLISMYSLHSLAALEYPNQAAGFMAIFWISICVMFLAVIINGKACIDWVSKQVKDMEKGVHRWRGGST